MVKLDDGGGGGGGDYSMIDISRMETLISSLKSEGETLQDTTEGFKSRASSLGVTDPAFTKVISTGTWCEDALPDLRRRLNLAKGLMGSTTPDYDTTYISEPLEMTAEEAEEKGRELAEDLKNHNRTDEEYVEIAERTFRDLELLYGNDPDVLSAFYAELGPQHTQMLPSLLGASGETGTATLERISRTLGTAFHDTDPPDGFKDVQTTLTSEPDHMPNPVCWDRLALLQWGDFPPDVTADIVKANGLDELDRSDGNVDWRMGGGSRMHLGLPDDLRALIFGALKNSPEATREAFRYQDMDKIVSNIYGDGNFNFELQQNFIEAMKAGAGVNDEQMGDHSAAAGSFALRFIKASASEENVPDLWVTKQGLSDIAASYAPELIASSNIKDTDRSGFVIPDNVDIPAGLDPQFLISPEEVYKFLHGFGEQDERFDPPVDYSESFDKAVGDLYNDSLLAAAEEMKKHPNSDAWQDTLTIYGNLAGLQHAGMLDVRDDMDKADQARKDFIANILNKGVGYIPTPQGFALKYGVKIGKYALGKVIGAWRETDPETTRVALLEDAEVQASFLRDYQLLNALNEADYPGTNEIPTELLDGDGHLKAPDEIAKDADLIEAYQDWVDSTDGPTDADIDSLTETEDFGGGFKRGEDTSTTYSWD